MPCKRPLGCCALLPLVRPYNCFLHCLFMCSTPASTKQPHTACSPSQLCHSWVGSCAGGLCMCRLSLFLGALHTCSFLWLQCRAGISHTSSPPSPRVCRVTRTCDSQRHTSVLFQARVWCVSSHPRHLVPLHSGIDLSAPLLCACVAPAAAVSIANAVAPIVLCACGWWCALGLAIHVCCAVPRCLVPQRP